MSRFTPYLGIVAALLVGVFIMDFSSTVTVLRTTPSVSSASSTLVVETGFTLPPLTLPDLVPKTSAAASSTLPIKKVKPLAPQPSATVTSAPPKIVSVSAPTVPTSSRNILNASASSLINALVNIICYVPAKSGLHSISGSGVIVDPKGIILTNAHVAQYFLLADRRVSCIIRTGTPAIDSYEASLIYISPMWLHANANVLTETLPSGTGEGDFALLAITKSATTTPFQISFPYVPLATTPPDTGTPVVIASYGAQFLESSQIQSSLFPTLVFGSVKDAFTFAVNTIDVLALGGSAVAQEGSSGGGVVDASGNLVGTITTSTISGATDTRSLDAITASYIRAEYANETGSALDLLLAGPTATAVSEFAPKIPALESIITAQLP